MRIRTYRRAMWADAIAEFLLARIAEDEAAARIAWADSGWETDGKRVYSPRDVVAKVSDDRTANFIVRNRPARVLAECEAKRRIVAQYLGTQDALKKANGVKSLAVELILDTLGDVLKALALPFADYPDYREEWRP